MTKLPRDERSQEIGRLAGRALGSKLPRSWIEKELDGDSDFGIDYFIQLKNSDNFVSFSFYLQLKGTTVPSYSADEKYVSYDFKVSTLRYYHQQEPLIMVAVVDLKDKEDKLWECPIYYFWLDEDWFSKNSNKLDVQQTISIKIPVTQVLDQSLDVYGFYAKRIGEKFAVAELKKEIKSQSGDVIRSVGALTEAISDKPIFLKTAENNGDEPWIENPKGEIPTLLKQCSDNLNANRLNRASEVLAQLERRKSDFNPHELAEYYFQEAAFLSTHGNYFEASERFKLSIKYSNKDRYKLGYIESKFKLRSIPTKAELVEIADSLPTHDYRNTIVKAKCLALSGEFVVALDILKDNFPGKVVGQLMILTMADEQGKIDALIRDIDIAILEGDREKYIYHSLVARRAFMKANGGSITFGKSIPIQGQVDVSLEEMKVACENLFKAWDYAKTLGYPSDVTMLFDISPLIFGYFNCAEKLFYHFEQMLAERPNHKDLIKVYSRLLFNDHQFEKVVELLGRISSDLEVDEYGILILSNYNLKRIRVALRILRDHEELLLEERPENLAIIFCIGAEMAQEILEEELAGKYLELVKSFDSGEALISVSNFIRNTNADHGNKEKYVSRLHEDYVELGKPLVIAEQLFRCLSPYELESAVKVVELANEILLVHELYEHDYFTLAQALITVGKFEEALGIASKHIEKERFDSNWHIIKVVCFQKLGKLGLAYNEIKMSLDKNRYSIGHLKHYVDICLQFGLLAEIEEALVDLLNGSEDTAEKLSFLSTLISIYFSGSEFSGKLIKAIRRFGQLVNREDIEEEGQFLIYFLMSPKNDNEKEVEEFRSRLADYSARFPDSHMLRQGSIDTGNGPEALMGSIHKMTGVTEYQLTLWEKNKNRIRNGSLPVPFVMLDRFLRDTRDIFTTWVLANNTPEDQLEYKLNQASQLDQERFDAIISEKKSIIIDDSSLLMLNEIGVLDKFLSEIDEICILDSTFERVSKNNHPLSGSIYSSIPQMILRAINKHKAKLRLISEVDDNPCDSIRNEMKCAGRLLVTDDINFLKLVTMGDETLNSGNSGNSFNVIEFLFNRSACTEEEKYTLISDVCSLGLHQPNMTLKLLSDSLVFFVGVANDVDYAETRFKGIFDKVFSVQRNTTSAIRLFFQMLFIALASKGAQFGTNTLISLFKGVLIRHQYKNFENFVAFWFVWQSMATSVELESEFLPVSPRHVEFFKIFTEIMHKIQDEGITSHGLLLSVVNQIFLLDENSRELAYRKIKSCFAPLTQDAELFEGIYREMVIGRNLTNF